MDMSVRFILRFYIQQDDRTFLMLVLTRKENESLVIGEDIKLTILAVKGGQVRVGIDAPKEVAIQRQELLLNIDDFTAQQVSDKGHQ